MMMPGDAADIAAERLLVPTGARQLPHGRVLQANRQSHLP